MKHVTRWRPDTCGCVLDYEWDDAVSEDQRTHTPVKTVACSAHAHLDTATEVFETVHTENTEKNTAIEALLQELPDEHSREVVSKDGTVSGRVFLIDPVWSFNEKRELQISHPALMNDAVDSKKAR